MLQDLSQAYPFQENLSKYIHLSTIILFYFGIEVHLNGNNAKLCEVYQDFPTQVS